MDGRKFHLHDGKKGAALAIRITPRASKNKVVEILSDGTVKVHLTADPSDQNTNDLLIKFLSQKLNISQDRLEIVAGDKGRDKLVSVLDMDADVLYQTILGLIDKI